MNKGISLKNTITLGCALAANCIGTAFASGQECRSYFTSWGFISYAGLLLFGILFAYQNAALFAFGHDSIDDKVKGTFQYCCGKYFGKVMDIMLPIFLFCVMTIMCSGAGTLFEAFGLPHLAGTILIVAIIYLTYLLDMRKIINVLGFVGGIIIAAAIIVCVISAVTGKDLADAGAFLQAHASEVSHAEKSWWYSAIAYSTLIPGTSVPFFAAMGRNASSKKEAILGAVLGSTLVVVADVLLNTAILSNIKTIYNMDMPVLQLAIMISPVLGIAFSVVVLMSMYSTAVPMLWMVCDSIPVRKQSLKNIVALGVAVLLLVLSQYSLDALINTMYPIMGWFTVLFLVLIVIRHVRNIMEKA